MQFAHDTEILLIRDFLLGKNRLRIFTLRLTGGVHRYHCSRRKQKPTPDVNKTLTGGAQRTSLNQSPGDHSRGFSTADSLWLGTRACAVLAISLRCQSMFRYFHCKARDPHVEAWRVGCHLSRPPRHLTEVPNRTVFERRVRYTSKDSYYRLNTFASLSLSHTQTTLRYLTISWFQNVEAVNIDIRLRSGVLLSQSANLAGWKNPRRQTSWKAHCFRLTSTCFSQIRRTLYIIYGY
ncbi:uncharacterized protein TNCV_216151 [Trichonephila clavipes]|nr:uncharacterized protein TNCV_216151 [Trichonephila clavipes]